VYSIQVGCIIMMHDMISPGAVSSTAEVTARLKTTRKALKLSQAALCRLTGISPQAWNNVETGDARIGLDNAIQLCDATGLTLDWVFRGIRSGMSTEIRTAIAEQETAEATGEA
jgi:transcriptional regulator with XRE-family HTH domain